MLHRIDVSTGIVFDKISQIHHFKFITSLSNLIHTLTVKLYFSYHFSFPHVLHITFYLSFYFLDPKRLAVALKQHESADIIIADSLNNLGKDENNAKKK